MQAAAAGRASPTPRLPPHPAKRLAAWWLLAAPRAARITSLASHQFCPLPSRFLRRALAPSRTGAQRAMAADAGLSSTVALSSFFRSLSRLRHARPHPLPHGAFARWSLLDGHPRPLLHGGRARFMAQKKRAGGKRSAKQATGVIDLRGRVPLCSSETHIVFLFNRQGQG